MATMWWSIKHAMNDKLGCSVTKVEKVVDGKTVEYTKEPDVVQCIQEETEVQFQLANSAPICKGLLGEQLGYLADTLQNPKPLVFPGVLSFLCQILNTREHHGF